MKLADLKSYAQAIAQQYPELAEDIRDVVSLAEDEIEEGSPEERECELAKTDIQDLLTELNE